MENFILIALGANLDAPMVNTIAETVAPLLLAVLMLLTRKSR